MHRTDIAVVGAGPAGMAAALAAAESGAQVMLLDEYSRAGGQFFKRAPEPFALARLQISREHDAGERLRAALWHKRIELWTSTLVWGAFADNTLMVYREGRSEVLKAKAIVLATGAYDRPVAFPGWTLPGVVTAGGAQTLAKTQWVKPGHRMLLSGAGPFMLPVAQQLLRVGVEIVAILEATGPRDWLRHAPALWGQWAHLVEAFDYWRSLRAARVTARFRQKVVRVLGVDKVEAAIVARIDSDWRAIPGTERTVEVDAVATAYGLLPNIELAVCSGCALRWDPFASVWFVACDGKMTTSRPNVFAAGEIVGIAGSAVALEEGRIAGISAAEHIGAMAVAEATQRRREPLKRRAQLGRFAEMLNQLFAPRAGLWEGLQSSTPVCRCEEVTAGELRAAIAHGCTSLKGLKDWTRAGMGLCQGRICRSIILRLIAEETNADPSDILPPHIRPPIKPVPIAALAQSELPEIATAAL